MLPVTIVVWVVQISLPGPVEEPNRRIRRSTPVACCRLVGSAGARVGLNEHVVDGPAELGSDG